MSPDKTITLIGRDKWIPTTWSQSILRLIRRARKLSRTSYRGKAFAAFWKTKIRAVLRGSPAWRSMFRSRPPPPTRPASCSNSTSPTRRSRVRSVWDWKICCYCVIAWRKNQSLRDRNPEPFYQLLHLAPQECKRRNDEQLILHARRIVIGFDDLVGHERTAADVGGKREGNFAGGGQNAGAENFDVPLFLDQAKFDAEPAEALQSEHLFAVRRGERGLADQSQDFRIILIHERRDMAEAVVDHVWLGCELRMRAVAD